MLGKLYGQEKNLTTSAIAPMNLFLHGAEDFHVERGDTLRLMEAKAALTELLAEVKNGKTPMVVERIVTDIDEIVRLVRFPGWQNTKVGKHEVQKALREVIYVKYPVKDQDLFDKAFGYIRQYY